MKKAILIIHGFIGTISDNEYLQNYLTYDSNFDVFSKTLPGHFKNNEDYQKVEYLEWIKFVDLEITELINHGYKSIYVIGHSMGGILAGYAASKYKEVKKVVFLNAAYTYLNLKQTKVDILENRDYKDYIEVFSRVLHTSFPFFLELVKLVKEYYGCLKDIKADALILQSDMDQVIPIETPMEIYNTIKSQEKYVTYLEGERHMIFDGSLENRSRKHEIAEYIRIFLNGGNKWRNIWKEKI